MADRNKASSSKLKSYPLSTWVRSMQESIELIELNFSLYDDAEIYRRHRTYYVTSATVNGQVDHAKLRWGETRHDFDHLYVFCWKYIKPVLTHRKNKSNKGLPHTLDISQRLYTKPLHIIIGYDRVNTKLYDYNAIMNSYGISPDLISAVDNYLQLNWKKHGKVIIDRNVIKI